VTVTAFGRPAKAEGLLCEGRKGRDLVGVELKHGTADRCVPAQMMDYKNKVERLATREGRRGFRGVIISRRPDRRLQRLLDAAAGGSKGMANPERCGRPSVNDLNEFRYNLNAAFVLAGQLDRLKIRVHGL